MPGTLKHIYASSPTTTRGKSSLIGGDPKDKKRVVYCCGKDVIIRDIHNLLDTDMYQEHVANTTVARLAPSGGYVASGDITGKVRIWGPSGEKILKLETPVIAGPITDLAWSEDSKRIVACGEGRQSFAKVFMFDSGSSVGEISGHEKFIITCDMKQTRPYRVATGGEDFKVNWYEGPPFKFSKSIKDHTRLVQCVRFSPNGEFFVSCGADKAVFLFEAKGGEKVGAFDGHQAGIYAAAWSPDSKKLLTASGDKTCKLWDVDSRACEVTFEFSDNPQVDDMQVGCLWLDANTLLSVNLAGYINLLDPANPKRPRRIIHGHQNAVVSVAYDAAGHRFFSGGSDGKIIAWDARTGETTLLSGQGHSNALVGMYVQGAHLVTSSIDDSVRRIPLASLNADQGSYLKLRSQPRGVAVASKHATLSAVTLSDAVLLLLDGQVVAEAPVTEATAVAFSADDSVLAVGAKNNKVYLFQIGANFKDLKPAPFGPLDYHLKEIASLAFSPCGKYLASGDAKNEIVIWETGSWAAKYKDWTFHTSTITTLIWSPNSKHLASGSNDNSIIVWNVDEPKKRLHIKRAHLGGVRDLKWLNETALVSSGDDNTIKTWDLVHE